MAKILVASSPEPCAILEQVLVGHELSCAQTMQQAEQLLCERPFDLIVCTVVFDESRMFDLLRQTKSHPQWRQTPFVCARIRSNVLSSPQALESVAFTCRDLGAVAFLNMAEYPVSEMRHAIEQFLHREEAPAT